MESKGSNWDAQGGSIYYLKHLSNEKCLRTTLFILNKLLIELEKGQ